MLTAAAALAVLALARSVLAYDPEAAFAKGTTVLGRQLGGGATSNVEGHRVVSDISFLTATPRVSYLFFPPFGSAWLRSAVESGVEGWFQHDLTPEGGGRPGSQARDALSS